jgi:acetolactate synthase-1/3 small subunit
VALFARRAYNLDAIVCLPVGDGSESRMWLRVHESDRLPQITSQVQKLHDVREVKVLHEKDVAVFREVGCSVTSNLRSEKNPLPPVEITS